MEKIRYYTLGFIPSTLKDDFLAIGGKIVHDAEGYMDVQFTSDYFTLIIVDSTITVFNLKELKQAVIPIDKQYQIHISD